jgi:hypothetical protein
MAQEIDDILSKIDDTMFGEYHAIKPHPFIGYAMITTARCIATELNRTCTGILMLLNNAE